MQILNKYNVCVYVCVCACVLIFQTICRPVLNQDGNMNIVVSKWNSSGRVGNPTPPRKVLFFFFKESSLGSIAFLAPMTRDFCPRRS